tara:strand:- start:15743 stop:16000 length:258 start_codon:yes stop_codon:yes gene_type:complete
MDKTEQEYLELAEHSKQKFEELENQKKELQYEIEQLKKELISTYGIVRVLDNLYANEEEKEPSIEMLIDILRSHLSTLIDIHIIF